tara:strand:+ start:63 stop:872 length:810 start_codon:yes stop_codon:yes gene_type:complete
MVLINPNPDPNQLLYQSYENNIQSEINIFTHQSDILAGYYSFLSDAVTLDFGEIRGKTQDRYDMIMHSFYNTLRFLFSGLLMAFLLSMMMLFLSRYSILKNTLVRLLCGISYFHISIIIYLLVYFIDINALSYLPKMIIVSMLVSIGSGILVDYYNLLKTEHDTIMNKDYVIFAKNSGFNQYYFALKELLFNLINISISRIPIIFGGLVIIEYYMRDSGMSGIIMFTLKIIKSRYVDNYSVFSALFVCVIFFTGLYFLSQSIQQKLIRK